MGLAYMAAAFNAVESKRDTLGGPTAEINPAPYYDPRGLLTRAPMDGIAPGEIVSTPCLDHGPSLFTYTEADVKPKTLYAPAGETVAEVLLLDATCEACCCVAVYPYSIMEAFMSRENVTALRGMLVQSGLVSITPPLAALGPWNACACRIMGGVAAGIYGAVGVYAGRYSDVSVKQVQDPANKLRFLNTVFISEMVANLKASVTSSSQANYLRAEGNRAYLQDYPQRAMTYDCDSMGLPEVLPRSGIEVVRTDPLFATRQLTIPVTKVGLRDMFRCQTGIPVGMNPCMHAPIPTPVTYKTEQKCPSFEEAAASTSGARKLPFQL